MSTIHSLYPKAGQQPVAISASNPLQVIGASHASLTTASSSGRVRARDFVVEVTSAMLESEAFNVPVDRLVNLWIARFGNDWVEMELVEKDEFFRNALVRLKQLGEVEIHYLTDRARYVCRMPE